MPKIAGPYRLNPEPLKPDPDIVQVLRILSREFGDIDLDDPDQEEAIAIWLESFVTVKPGALEE